VLGLGAVLVGHAVRGRTAPAPDTPDREPALAG
jgi:hypothetical protein